MVKTDEGSPKNDQKKQKPKIKITPKKIQKGKKVAPKGKPAKPQGEIKFYYFDCYAVGEPIRMALHKAGVKYQDIRFTYDPPRQ